MSNTNKIFKEQLRIEKRSIKLYNSFIKKIKDKKIKRSIAGIREDEKEHVKLVEKMIWIIRHI